MIASSKMATICHETPNTARFVTRGTPCGKSGTSTSVARITKTATGAKVPRINAFPNCPEIAERMSDMPSAPVQGGQAETGWPGLTLADRGYVHCGSVSIIMDMA